MVGATRGCSTNRLTVAFVSSFRVEQLDEMGLESAFVIASTLDRIYFSVVNPAIATCSSWCDLTPETPIPFRHSLFINDGNPP